MFARRLPALARLVSPRMLLAQKSFTAPVFARSYITEPPQEIIYPAPRVRVRGKAADFEAEAVINGEISSLKLSDYKGKWVVLFFYPKDFTYVCPTEIIAFSDRAGEFKAVGAEVIAASADTPEVHLAWIRTSRKSGGLGHMQIPLVSDPTRAITNDYGVLIKEDGIPLRGLFIIDPEGTVQQATINNNPVGRSVDEALRLVQAYQFNAKHGEVCPAGWTPGAATMVDHPDKSLEYFRAVNTEESATGSIGGNVAVASTSDAVTAAIQAGEPTVIFHGASWCGKCKMIAPFVADLSEKYGGVKFVKVDISDQAFVDYTVAKGIVSLPEFRFYKAGAEVGTRIIGYKKPALEKAVKSLLL